MTRSKAETQALVAAATKRWGGRHRWVCVYCGRVANQVDHFWPEHGGGTSDPMNLVPACEACNSRKQSRDPVAWMKAVGVPFARAEIIWAIVHTTEPTLARQAHFPRITLDYAPGRLVEAL